MSAQRTEPTLERSQPIAAFFRVQSQRKAAWAESVTSLCTCDRIALPAGKLPLAAPPANGNFTQKAGGLFLLKLF